MYGSKCIPVLRCVVPPRTVFVCLSILAILITEIVTPCHCQAIENFDASNLTLPKLYTFTKPDSNLLLTASESISRKLILSKREISFTFRTPYPHGILFHEKLFSSTEKIHHLYELLLTLQGSRIRLQLALRDGDVQEQLMLGYGFDTDTFHHVKLYIDPQLGNITIRVNSTEVNHFESLAFNSSVEDELNSYKYHLSFGGLALIHNDKFQYETLALKHFVGCLGNVKIVTRSNRSNFDTLSASHIYLNQIDEGCIDQCKKLNLCSRKAQCINYYDHKNCDCFSTELEDWHCRSYNYTVLTFRGYSTISYILYPFGEKAYSNRHRISLHLKTEHDAILFMAFSESIQNYLILNIKNGFLNLLFNLGNDPKNYIFNDFNLIDDKWHNVTLIQDGGNITIWLDVNTTHVISLEGFNNTYFYFDPEIYFGGLPSDLSVFKLNLPLHLPNKRFVGCLKHVYFNHINILYDLNSHHKLAKYHSMFPPELGCSSIHSVPITIQPKSYFFVPLNKSFSLSLELEFFSSIHNFELANGTFVTADGEKRKWHLLVRKYDVKLSIETVPETRNQIGWTLSTDNSLGLERWNHIRILFEPDQSIQMSVNQIAVKGRYDWVIDKFRDVVTIGSIDSHFIGCVRNVIVDERVVEPRTLHEEQLVIGRVSMDGCQLLNPCNRPNPCEHGGVCVPVPENGNFRCDCSNTGYIGRTCHFSLYRKSCEEIYLMDKFHSGIYMIDIDRNGPLPPAHVICDLDDNNNDTVTIRTVIEHNIQHQVIVREKGKHGDYFMNVTYRDFNALMLRRIVEKSNRCQQYVRYECNNAPLSLSTYTMLYSTIPDHKLVRIDDGTLVGCQCSSTKPNRCADSRKRCNCDADLPGWKRDEGYLTHPKDVGITRMFFLQFPNITESSEAHLFIGNLSCVDTNTQQFEITFKTKESYLEVPGWKGKEMGISFRTTANRAVIFYQSHHDNNSTYFKAIIKSENEVSFEYVIRGRKHVITVSSSLCLNCGQWQHIWIERNENQMRVSVNQNFKIMYLKGNEKFIDFDGRLFVGGAPIEYLKGLKITLGFIGCLRGLVFDNDEVINLHRYLNQHKMPNIESGCRPYCKPNICQNQGTCVELWGSYRCECSNPIAHSGRNCEININENGITFKEPTFLRKVFQNTSEIQAILEEDIVISFRTHQKYSLLLYIHDVNRNFLQLHLENGTSVVMTYNSLRKIVQRHIFIGSVLTSGNTVQVKIDRRYQNHTVFTANKNRVSIPYPVKFLKSHEDFGIDKSMPDLVLLKPTDSEEWQQNEMFVGGVDKDSTISMIPPFVGCIQGLIANGKLVNLQEMASSLNAVNVTSVKPGCKMLCDEMPCKNGGLCTEDWQNESIKCDCDSTSYRGNLCDVDIGVFFERNSSVEYQLDEGVLDFENIEITFAFSTNNLANSTLFLLMYANSTRYLHIALLEDGKILVEEDNGHDIYFTIVENEEDQYQDSYRHWVHYVRKGRSAQIIVDSIIYMIFETFKETENDIPNAVENLILIGSNEIQNQNFHQFSNFIGCISNINIILDDFKIDPLESAFGMRSGLNKVKVFGVYQQRKCALFRTHRASVPIMDPDQTLTLTNREEIWLNRPKPNLSLYKKKSKSNQGAKFLRTNVIITICAVYLVLIIIFVGHYIWRIDKRYRLLKFQGETPFFKRKSHLKRLKKSGFAL